MRDLMRHLTDSLESGREVLLCRVVATRGSTPQKAGAAMLLAPGGGQIGTLGGGCVEDEVKRKAAGMAGRDGAELHSFVLNHDYAWADGLICGGKMVILAECPRGPGHLAYYRAYRELLEAGRGFTEAIVLDPGRSGGPGSAVGDRFLFDHEGRAFASLSGGDPPDRIAGGVAPLDDRPSAVGGGRRGLPADDAAQSDWSSSAPGTWARRSPSWPPGPTSTSGSSTTVASTPTPSGSPTPGGWSSARSGKSCRISRSRPQTYALIVTRGHGHDQEALRHLAPTAASYVGLIGSRRKIKMIFEALLDEGVDERALARVSAPVGLDIGSESVAEIAVSIVAELIARRNRGPAALQGLRATLQQPQG